MTPCVLHQPMHRLPTDYFSRLAANVMQLLPQTQGVSHTTHLPASRAAGPQNSTFSCIAPFPLPFLLLLPPPLPTFLQELWRQGLPLTPQALTLLPVLLLPGKHTGPHNTKLLPTAGQSGTPQPNSTGYYTAWGAALSSTAVGF